MCSWLGRNEDVEGFDGLWVDGEISGTGAGVGDPSRMSRIGCWVRWAPPPVFPYVLVAYGFGFSTGKVSTVVFPSAIFLTLGCGSINHPSLMMNSTVTFGLTTLFGAFFSLEEVVDLSYNLFVRTKCSQTLQDCVFCASPWGCLFLTFV